MSESRQLRCCECVDNVVEHTKWAGRTLGVSPAGYRGNQVRDAFDIKEARTMTLLIVKGRVRPSEGLE